MPCQDQRGPNGTRRPCAALRPRPRTEMAPGGQASPRPPAQAQTGQSGGSISLHLCPQVGVSRYQRNPRDQPLLRTQGPSSAVPPAWPDPLCSSSPSSLCPRDLLMASQETAPGLLFCLPLPSVWLSAQGDCSLCLPPSRVLDPVGADPASLGEGGFGDTWSPST